MEEYLRFSNTGLYVFDFFKNHFRCKLFLDYFRNDMSQNLKFLIILSTIFLAIDFYTWQGVKLLTQGWSDKGKLILKLVYWGYTGLNLLFFMSWRMGWLQFPHLVLRMVTAIFGMLLFAKLFWCVFLLMDDLIRLGKWVGSLFQGAPENVLDSGVEKSKGISRLRFLSYLGFGVGSTFFGTSLYGIARGAHNYKVRKRDLFIIGLPESFEGLKLVQISDIHTGSFWDRKAVSRGIDMIANLKADMVFFTGDLVNDLAEELHGWKELYSKIKAPLGVYSILGNHDYGDYHPWPDHTSNKPPQADKSHMSPMQLKNLEKLKESHAEIGWDLLLDEHRIIEKNGHQIAVLGVENWSSKARFPKYGNLKSAYAGAEHIPVKLLLSHDPSHWREEVVNQYSDIKATFSGHTHGMQFGIDSKFYRWSPVKYMYPQWIDLYTENEQHLYVNRGFGYLGFPGRMGVYPEITLFTLRGK